MSLSDYISPDELKAMVIGMALGFALGVAFMCAVVALAG